MRERSSIKVEIPVPWATSCACIEASGRPAVIVGGIVAVIIAGLIVWYAI